MARQPLANLRVYRWVSALTLKRCSVHALGLAVLCFKAGAHL